MQPYKLISVRVYYHKNKCKFIFFEEKIAIKHFTDEHLIMTIIVHSSW